MTSTLATMRATRRLKLRATRRLTMRATRRLTRKRVPMRMRVRQGSGD